jgi:hypothetical protein
MAKMIDWALWYASQNLDVVPVVPREKNVALPAWEEYQTRCSTISEIKSWWSHTPNANIGLVSGVNNFVTIDVDHNGGAFEQMRDKFPEMFVGRIEQSGSGQGYHIPLFVASLPDFGYDNSKQRPKGNKTWHTKTGDVNIRARWCQAVCPPSVHPSGGIYRFIQQGDIVRAPDLTAVIAWLNELDPSARIVTQRHEQHQNDTPNRMPIKAYFPSVLEAFKMLGYTDPVEQEPNGETRISGHGGLLVDADDSRFYCFSDEVGGDVVDAFGWSRFGARWNRYDKGMFQTVMRDMEKAAGVGEVRELSRVPPMRKTVNVWGPKLKSGYWSRT